MTNNKEDKSLIGSDLDSWISGLLQKLCFDTDNKLTRHSGVKNVGSALTLGISLKNDSMNLINDHLTSGEAVAKGTKQFLCECIE